MEQRLSLVTLAAADLAASRRFYEGGLGWTASFTNDEVAFYQAGSIVVGLYRRQNFAADAGVPEETLSGSGIALAHNVRSKEEVGLLLAAAVQAGGTLVKPGRDTPWGGHSGYFLDPDGHLWEVAWNPHWTLAKDGSVRI